MNRYLIALLILSGTTLGKAQANFTLQAAKEYALEHNTNIQIAASKVNYADYEMKEVTGMGLPQINMNGSFNNYINIPVQVVDGAFVGMPGTLVEFKMGTEYNASGSLQVNQLIFNGSYIVGLQVAAFYRKFEEANSEITKEDVIFNVIQAYELSAVAKENLSFTDSMVILTQELITKQQNYLDLGLMVQEDMDQLNYSLSIAKNSALNSKVQYENAITLLKFAMGYPMDQPIEITDGSDLLIEKSAVAKGAFTDNLTYQLLEKKIVLSDFNIKNEKMASLPSLNGFFQHTYNAYRNEFNFFADEKWFPQTLWGLQLNVPIFSGLQRHSRVQQAKITKYQDELNLSQYARSLQLQEVQATNNLRTAEDKYTLQKENVVLAQSIYEKAILKEQIGKGNSIIVTQKYNQLMAAQAQMVAAKIELFQAKLALDKIYNNIISNN